MKKAKELPLAEPIYSTYHSQGADGVVFAGNPSIINWYYNHLSMLYCNKQFLYGYTTPELFVYESAFWENPYLNVIKIPLQYLGSSIHKVMRSFIDDNHYLFFNGIDDFYIKGKSWYQKRHFKHDGLLYGYDQNDRTYSIFAYDQTWRYRGFKVSQEDFEAGRKSAVNLHFNGTLFAIKPYAVTIALDPNEIFENIREYLGYSHRKKYTPLMDHMVFGIETHEYMAMYLIMLENRDIPYEKMDWRIFRQLWEHKKVMQGRIAAVEQKYNALPSISKEYSEVVKIADEIRMAYAVYHRKRNDSILPAIRKKVLEISKMEYQILHNFLELVK